MTLPHAPSFALIPFFPPPWAEVFGEDDAGVFAEFVVKEVRFVWRWIPPGRFLMGSPANETGRFGDEGPQHEVTISRGFWLGETPVTQAQWLALRAENPSGFKGDDRPVESVTWPHCADFAAALNAAVPGLAAGLPTEAQWEYACRAGTTAAFHDGSPCTKPEGNDLALVRLGWFDKNSGGGSHPVKQKLPNGWGLCDLHGNVWEWCRDGRRTYTAEPQTDPVGPMEAGATRVVRGGSWGTHARYCRAAIRFAWHPGSRNHPRGFRLAAGQEPGAAERPPGPVDAEPGPEG
jgi:formylglycine-generating enzyme required for sulfatase activity